MPHRRRWWLSKHSDDAGIHGEEDKVRRETICDDDSSILLGEVRVAELFDPLLARAAAGLVLGALLLMSVALSLTTDGGSLSAKPGLALALALAIMSALGTAAAHSTLIGATGLHTRELTLPLEALAAAMVEAAHARPSAPSTQTAVVAATDESDVARVAHNTESVTDDAARLRATRARALMPSRVFEVQRMQESFLTMQRVNTSFGRFVPHQLVRHLLKIDREAKLGVQPREVTIFFSDIEGFTSLSEV